MAVCYDGISIQNRRKVNMDSLLLKSRSVQGTQLCIAAVCDGVGGLADGAFAASEAVTMLRNWFENLEEKECLGLRLRNFVDSINYAVAAKAKLKQIRTACTLSCLVLWEGQYAVAHVGDSRIYTVDRAGLHLLTKDQVQEGRLTASIGHQETTDIFYTEGEYSSGQRFLLCSDGLYKRMDVNLLEEALREASSRNPQKTLRRLTEYVVGQGERDNISAALLVSE